MSFIKSLEMGLRFQVLGSLASLGSEGVIVFKTPRKRKKKTFTHRRSSTLRRPIQLLYPLEIRSGNEPVTMGKHENSAVNHADEVHQ